MLEPPLRHELHADADAEERRPAVHRMGDRLAHSRNRAKPRGAIGEGPLAGQHDPVRRRNLPRLAGDAHLGRNALLGGRPLQRPRRRGKVPAAVIDHRDLHASRPACCGRSAR